MAFISMTTQLLLGLFLSGAINEVLGGYTETLYLENGQYIDYGVQGCLGVDYKPLRSSSLVREYVDFRTGKKAATVYRAAVEKFSYPEGGLYNLPDPVPEERLQPFGDFVKKAGIQDALQVVKTFAHGAGDMLQAPLLRVLQLCGLPQIDSLLQGGYITPKNGMYEINRRVLGILKSDVLYQTSVAETERSSGGIKIVVESANGTRKLIKASQLLVTFVPIMEYLQRFDLVTAESSLFQKLDWMNYYVTVVKDMGLPSAMAVVSADPESTPGNLPLPPFQLELQTLTPQEVKNVVLSDIRRMSKAGTSPKDDPDIVVFGGHTPTAVSVSNAEVRDGFYPKLYALQGVKNTFYTGLAFCSDYSSLLWVYTDTVIEMMSSPATGPCYL
ncbi:hypothetical protein BDV26DRAFT_278626 [Aspergillus bertholletiae]|uniref:Amine oxidase domain-containing protein n=1 Tax=Aspergillus bertholletiae TaxID=1226010 RepID=A0A5N7BIN4_9EURO|nr:hypothetical protein BDV26DRAFT_278626 [Aspergillus bertholletiae]